MPRFLEDLAPRDQAKLKALIDEFSTLWAATEQRRRLRAAMRQLAAEHGEEFTTDDVIVVVIKSDADIPTVRQVRPTNTHKGKKSRRIWRHGE